MTVDEFKKRFPEHRYKNIRVIKADEENEEVQVGGKVVPRIGQDVVIVESKPVSRIAWLVAGSVAFGFGMYLFKRYGPQAPPQQFVLQQGEAALPPDEAALAEAMGE